MIQLIFDEDVQIRREPEVKIIRQVRSVISPGQRNDLHRVPLRTEVLNQLAIIHVSATERVERAINDESKSHGFGV
jgi:hypothetical protein